MQAQESAARQSQEAELRKWAEAELLVLQHDHSSRFAEVSKRVGAVEAALAEGGGKVVQARRRTTKPRANCGLVSFSLTGRDGSFGAQASFDRVHSAMKELSDRKTRELGVVRSEIEASYGAFVEAHRDTMSRLTSTVTSARDEVRPTAPQSIGPIQKIIRRCMQWTRVPRAYCPQRTANSPLRMRAPTRACADGRARTDRGRATKKAQHTRVRARACARVHGLLRA